MYAYFSLSPPNHVNFKIAGWVSSEILYCETPKERIEKIMHFVTVASKCIELGNFNGFYSILGGLQCTPILRLDRTWALVDRREAATFAAHRQLMSPEDNSGAYRARLSSCKTTCIPYLGTLARPLLQYQ